MLPVVAAALLFAQTPSDAAREIVDLLLAGKYAAVVERFNPKMKEGLPADQLQIGAERLKGFGALTKILPAEPSTVNAMDVVVVPLAYERLTVEVLVTFEKTGQVAGLYFRPRMKSDIPWSPPAYSKSGSFRSEEVTVGEWPLPGTLLLPAGKGPFPALLLVHGSGPNDRDESVAGAKVFRDLAEGLASRGIAVLRYDKRTRQHASKMVGLTEFTIDDETVNDAVAAAAFLRGRAEVDARRVFVLGHSLGGYAAPRIGKRDPKLAGLIILAGNTRPLEDLFVEQTAYIASLQKTPGVEKQLEEVKQVAARIKIVKPGEPSQPVLGAPASYWLDLQTYRPAEVARGLKMPILVLQGERDYQVTMADFAGWKAALSATATLKSYPALNHLFIEGEGKGTPAEYNKPGHVAAEVIEDIAAWIGKR
jgi:dienelactone hydrolase